MFLTGPDASEDEIIMAEEKALLCLYIAYLMKVLIRHWAISNFTTMLRQEQHFCSPVVFSLYQQLPLITALKCTYRYSNENENCCSQKTWG